MKHQHGAYDLPMAVTDGGGTGFYRDDFSIALDQPGMIGGRYDTISLDGFFRRVIQRVAGVFINDIEYLRRRLSVCSGVGPAS